MYILGIDVGTTSVRALLFDKQANVIKVNSELIPVICPEPGRAEQDPELLWQMCVRVIQKTTVDIRIEDIKAIGITTQRNSHVSWNKETGEPLHNIILWEDVRTANLCEQLNNSATMKSIRAICSVGHAVTGVQKLGAGSTVKFGTMQSVVGLCWLLRNHEKVKECHKQHKMLWGTTDVWLLYKLTGGKVHATDYSNISSTGLWDPFAMNWNSLVLHLCGIPKEVLPQVKDTSCHFGDCLPSVFGPENKVQVPITAICADQQSALFGQCSFEPGDIKVTLGTGGFVEINTGKHAYASKYGLYPLVGWKIKDDTTYLIEGGANMGSVIDWGASIGLYSDATEAEQMALSVPDTNDTYFIAAFSGLSQPYDDPHARGTLIGITRATKKEHIVRSILEGIAFRISELIKCVEKDIPIKPKSIRFDGGVTRSDFIMQFISDTIQKPIDLAEQQEMTCQGVAFLAGLAVGFWKNKEELSNLRKTKKMYFPRSIDEEQKEIRLAKYQRAIRASSGWDAPIL